MSRYIRSSKEVYDFDGDKVEVILKPILFEDVLRFRGITTEDGDESRIVACQKLFSEIIPKYIEKFSLRAADGTEVTVQELCSVAYFSPLVIQIGADIIKTGSVQNPSNAVVQSGS